MTVHMNGHVIINCNWPASFRYHILPHVPFCKAHQG
jgi:hypothetical protein